MEPGVLRAALASLSSGDQEVLRLVAWDGLTPAQVAVVLGCTPVAARTRLHRARSRLAARLGIGLDQRRKSPATARADEGPSALLQRSGSPEQKQGASAGKHSPDSLEVP